jgi:hypothetical protein
MDIKDLNKSQLVLLTILVSFITSIATGIATVTLLQQAPTSVVTPIHRVVRQTVEKIVPGNTKVETIVVKEEDLIVDAIAKNRPAVFSVTQEVSGSETSEIVEVPAGRGFTITSEGILVADASMIPAEGIYYVKNESGKFKADFISADKKGFSFLKIIVPSEEKNKLTFVVPSSGDISRMKIGQKVIILSSTISSFIYDGYENLSLNVVKANAGALVIDLDGNALGIALAGDGASFASISDIQDALKSSQTPKQ